MPATICLVIATSWIRLWKDTISIQFSDQFVLLFAGSCFLVWMRGLHVGSSDRFPLAVEYQCSTIFTSFTLFFCGHMNGLLLQLRRSVRRRLSHPIASYDALYLDNLEIIPKKCHIPFHLPFWPDGSIMHQIDPCSICAFCLWNANKFRKYNIQSLSSSMSDHEGTEF